VTQKQDRCYFSVYTARSD